MFYHAYKMMLSKGLNPFFKELLYLQKKSCPLNQESKELWCKEQEFFVLQNVSLHHSDTLCIDKDPLIHYVKSLKNVGLSLSIYADLDAVINSDIIKSYANGIECGLNLSLITIGISVQACIY